MAGSRAAILTLQPSPQYFYQPGEDPGFAKTSAVHQRLLGRKLLVSKGHPSSWESFLTPMGSPGLQGHWTGIPELFQRCPECHTRQLPSLPHVCALPCPTACPSPSSVEEMPLHPALRSATSKMGL